MSTFPTTRLRRLRRTESLRKMFDINMPGPEKFVWPVFLVDGKGKREAIKAMPGQNRLSVDSLITDLKPVVESGVGGVLLFGVAKKTQKDERGTYAHDESGVVQQAVGEIKKKYPELVVITDVCVCAYTTHGHCGPITEGGEVDNDASNEILSNVAVSHAMAGADIVAPSAMMDGQVGAIRTALDQSGFNQTLLMSYSTKFASAMYGPFREAEKSAPQAGDRKGYQGSYGDPRQALRESFMDEDEGADILMVKPSLFYLDILAKLRESTDLPIAAYNVSGEYSMLHASAEKGWGDLQGMVRESTTALVRAGTDIIISYWANQYRDLLG